jgi:hypothetical protein
MLRFRWEPESVESAQPYSLAMPQGPGPQGFGGVL